jgi:hypothetical protein
MASDPENINFLDLACLMKIAPETTLEKFGSLINASVFDAANETGSLKQKGLIDFTAFYPGPNSIIVTDVGKKLKEEAETKSSEGVDSLDEEILKQMSAGKRFPAELASTTNVRSRDLAFRLYKLFKQNLLSFELKNGNVELMLTEQGFLKAKTPQVVQPQPEPTPQPEMQTPEQVMWGVKGASKPNLALKKPRSVRKIILILVLLIIIVAAAVLALAYEGYVTLPFALPSI